MGAQAERDLMTLALKGEMKRDALRRAVNTRAGYAADWRLFTRWCKEQGCESLPATSQTVLLYSHAQLEGGKKVSTAIRYLSAINSYHHAAGEPAPATTDAWQFLFAIKRMRGEQPVQKAAISVDELRLMVSAQPQTPRGLRDRAVLTLGFASALRRSTLAALALDEVEFRSEGLVLTIRKEKQDRKGEGRVVGIAPGKNPDTDPCRNLVHWLSQRGARPGPLFCPVYQGHVVLRQMQPAAIARIVKDAARAVGLDPTRFAGHSLRAGMVTAAIEGGAGELVLAAHTGHKSLAMLRKYFRRSDPFRANATGLLGL